MKKSKSPSQLTDARIKELGDLRGEMLSRLRALVKEADPEVVEEWKWRGIPGPSIDTSVPPALHRRRRTQGHHLRVARKRNLSRLA